jgi:hypothetical protein
MRIAPWSFDIFLCKNRQSDRLTFDKSAVCKTGKPCTCIRSNRVNCYWRTQLRAIKP